MKKIFTPIQIGNLTLKNRIMMSPMENGMAHTGGMISDRIIEFFSERARHGTGIIMTGSVTVSPEGAGLPAQIAIYDDAFLPGLTKLCDRVHAEGAKIGAQIYHAGRQATAAITGIQPVAPSALPCPLLNNSPRALEAGEISEYVEKFRMGARRAIAAGFDLIEVHFAHGYLLASFLSPLSNKRTDEYGGSLENRCRFPMEVLKVIVAEAAGKIPVTIRISVSEFVESGLDFEDVKRICLMAQGAGAQAVSITAGCYEAIHTSIQPMYVPQGFLIPYAEELKSILSVPVIVAGRLNNASLLESIVEDGKADIVAIGRGLIADPALPEKMQEGRYDDIRYCVACNQGCCDYLFRGESITCMLNAQASFEKERRLAPAAAKNVVVIGAGPAGLEAARVASLRGHNVILLEKDRPGGKFPLLAAPPEKETFLLFLEYLKTQVAKQGVQLEQADVRSPDDIARFQPDHVIIATGASQTIPPIPGSDLPNVLLAEDILARQKNPGKSAVIIGGGLVGVETAHFLGELGIRTTILEKLDTIAREAGATYAEHIRATLKKYNIPDITGANIVRIQPDGVMTEEGLIEADSVIIAAGYASRNELAVPMEKAFGNVTVIGDARKPANILQAVHDGYLCAAAI